MNTGSKTIDNLPPAKIQTPNSTRGPQNNKQSLHQSFHNTMFGEKLAWGYPGNRIRTQGFQNNWFRSKYQVNGFIFLCCNTASGIILGMGSTNDTRRYIVTHCIIGRAHTRNDPWACHLLAIFGANTPIPCHMAEPQSIIHRSDNVELWGNWFHCYLPWRHLQ